MEIALDAVHATNSDDLGRVRADMLKMGAPTIRAIEDGGRLVAIEGTHRLAVAADLGLTPRIVVLGDDDVVPADNDLDDGAFRGQPISALREYLLSGDGTTGARYWVEVE